jgi:outer membrane murein-binding lipoprotein Lpp
MALYLSLKLRQDVKPLDVRQVCGAASLEDDMLHMPKIVIAAVFVPALLLTTGCANREEMDSLRSEVNALRTDLSSIKSSSMESAASAKQAAEAAQQAAAAAEKAAAEAKASSDKADKIYRQSLRK